MLALSLRAVLRKESWMFCAGLLFSIADLLLLCELQTATAAHPIRGKAQVTVCSRPLRSCLGTQGDNPPCRSHPSGAQQPGGQVVSTIRRSAPLFNREFDLATRREGAFTF